MKPPATESGIGERRLRGQLFAKYVALVAAVVTIALNSSGAFEVWFSYREHNAALFRIQQEQAAAAAAKIATFIAEIQGQLGWTTQLAWSPGKLEQRRFDACGCCGRFPPLPSCRKSIPAAKSSCVFRGLPWTL